MAVPSSPAIGSHRLLGAGSSAALLTPDATVDWWCAPAFDNRPVLWSLLDPSGAAARWCGVRMAEADGPPAGPTARTVVHHPGGRVLCWDGLVLGGEAKPTLVRLVRALDHDVELEHEVALGGFDGPWAGWTLEGGGVATAGPAGHPVTVVGGTHRAPERWLRTTVTAVSDRWTGLVVSFGPPAGSSGDDGARAGGGERGDEPSGRGPVGGPRRSADPVALVAELEAAEAEHRDYLDEATIPRAGRETGRAEDALAVLRACTSEPTGAVVASPTTSLPEASGGDRQFDYRYTWLRDTSLAVSVAALLGRSDLARRHLDFVLGQATETRVPNGPMTDVRGESVPAEREVPGVAGWDGAQPVRVGNGAADQVQYDGLGLLIESVSVFVQLGGRLDGATWDLVRAVADRAAEAGDEPTSGIWELRDPRRLLSADIGRWMTLDRALWIARLRRPWTPRRGWALARREIRRKVVAALDEGGGLPQAYDGPGAAEDDASALMAVVFGLLGPKDPRAGRLVDATIHRLGAWPLLYRYQPGGDDGFHGREGAFVPASWWAVAALAKLGRVDEAQARLTALDRVLPRLQPEELDPERHTALGNTPLVWSHMEAARALYLLDVARVRKRYGGVAVVIWRLNRLRQVWAKRS